MEVCIFNIGANVNFPILETTERVFRKVWEMACYSGFLAGREAARLMLPRGKGNIFFTGATASLARRQRLCRLCQRQIRPARGGAGDGARTGAEEHPCRASRSSIPASTPNGCGSAACEALGPDALDDPDLLMPPAAVAASYWQLYQQPKSAWTFELEIRPFGEKW